MLKPIKLKLHNFCQHTSREVPFQQGMTALLGANFSGKSNIFRGFVYALTGWCDPSWGTQTDLQKDDELTPGYAELTFSCDNETYRIKRFTVSGVKYPDVIMDTEGKELVQKRSKVDEWIAEHVGVSTVILAQLIWLRQENSAWLLTAPAAGITSFLAQIFDTKRLEKLRDALKLTVDKVAQLRSDFNERVEQLQAEQENLPNMEDLEKQLAAEKQKLEELKSAYAPYKTMTLVDPAIKEQQLKHNAELIEHTRKRMEQYVPMELGEILPDLDPLLKLEKEKYQQTADLTQLINSTAAEIAKCELEISKLKHIETSVDHCELCHASIADITTYKRNKAHMLGISDKDEASWQKDLSEMQKTKVLAEKAREKTEGEAAELGKQIQETASKKEYYRLLMLIQSVEKNTEELQKQETSDPATVAKVKSLETDIKLTEHSITQLEQQIANTRAKQMYIVEAAEACKQDEQLYIRNNTIRQILSRSRDVLSQNRAQARYMAAQIDRLNHFIAEYVALSEMPFTLKLDPTKRVFKYKMTDSDVEHPAARLSGAQKAIASIAVQMALIATVSPNINTICVDETDAALDASNKFMAATLYRSLVGTLAGQEGSVLVISHSDTVLETADYTYSLT